MILDDILGYKREEVARQRRATPLAEVRAAARRHHEQGLDPPAAARTGTVPGGAFHRALREPGVSLIAEAKHRSPSKGILRADYVPSDLALTYARNGAAAVSILTDQRFFGGHISHLVAARDALAPTGFCVPLLRKDFIFDEYQVYQTRAAGADALLLIAAALSDSEMTRLLSLTRELAMEALVEVRDESEIERALRAGARIVGVNNRDLRDFSVDLATFGRLRKRIPSGVLAVAESGIHDKDDVVRVRGMGADAVLVGEAIVTALDTDAMVRELVQGGGV